MQSHQSRPLTQELEEMYRIAVREHGPFARSARLIGQALAECRQELRDARGQAPVPVRAGRTQRSREGPR
ncbi:MULTISPECIES: hypothetical protein [Ramlibacter]|uniref:Uncharacterized protein n=1 Tax=Ramlibacter pinisoli TaxID=2682844 RepID=A0A6N8ISN4_9BURK|nr:MULTISPECIES: hypothetical protein [Ramlibacter]MBA2964254.1 hypothetical protein [Ramlibacter sp. CGMCC 1.13660]MVQ29220.1 hypothetical protein [Ramlibacter pinisoli]